MRGAHAVGRVNILQFGKCFSYELHRTFNICVRGFAA